MARDTAPLANVITPGAHNLQMLPDFYLRLGWPQVVDQDDLAAFDLHNAVLALFAVDKLAADGRAEPERGRGGSALRSASSSTVLTRSTRWLVSSKGPEGGSRRSRSTRSSSRAGRRWSPTPKAVTEDQPGAGSAPSCCNRPSRSS